MPFLVIFLNRVTPKLDFKVTIFFYLEYTVKQKNMPLQS